MFFVLKIRERGFITYFHLFNYYITLNLALLYQICYKSYCPGFMVSNLKKNEIKMTRCSILESV